MQTEKNKKIGLGILAFSFLGMFFFLDFFNLYGQKISYQNKSLLLEAVFTFGILLIGLYFGLYFTNGKKLANQIGGGMMLFLILAFVFSLMFH